MVPSLVALLSIVVPSYKPMTVLPLPATVDTAVFAGGCFWGVEGIFEHVKGVLSVTSGYAGGDLASPTSAQVYAGNTGHAESVRIVFDSAQVSYQQLLTIFFLIAHDPTELNRQGPDSGTDYRSIAFYRDSTQRRAIEAYIADLRVKRAYVYPIVTEVVALRAFYPAEAFHQHYMEFHMNDAYIVTNDVPRLEALQSQFPGLYRPKWHG
jgi:peptide-methionine (S)-S-oxide reductase